MTTLIVFLLLFIFCAAVYAVGETINNRIKLQNACDAAAYSAAVIQADGLSRMAIVNKAMSWTYIQMTNRQMDYITYRWIKLTLKRYEEDHKAAKHYAEQLIICVDPSLGWWAILEAVVSGIINALLDLHCDTGGHHKDHNPLAWNCSSIQDKDNRILFNDHLFSIPLDPLKKVISPLGSIIDTDDSPSGWAGRLGFLIDHDKKNISNLNNVLDLINQQMTQSMRATAESVLKSSLADSKLGSSDALSNYSISIKIPEGKNPYSLEDDDTSFFSPLHNTEADERSFLELQGNSDNTDRNLAAYFPVLLGGNTNQACGIDQWFIRGKGTYEGGDTDDDEDPNDTLCLSSPADNSYSGGKSGHLEDGGRLTGTVRDEGSLGIQRVYKDTNLNEAGKGFFHPVDRGNHLINFADFIKGALQTGLSFLNSKNEQGMSLGTSGLGPGEYDNIDDAIRDLTKQDMDLAAMDNKLKHDQIMAGSDEERAKIQQQRDDIHKQQDKIHETQNQLASHKGEADKAKAQAPAYESEKSGKGSSGSKGGSGGSGSKGGSGSSSKGGSGGKGGSGKGGKGGKGGALGSLGGLGGGGGGEAGGIASGDFTSDGAMGQVVGLAEDLLNNLLGDLLDVDPSCEHVKPKELFWPPMCLHANETTALVAQYRWASAKWYCATKLWTWILSLLFNGADIWCDIYPKTFLDLGLIKLKGGGYGHWSFPKWFDGMEPHCLLSTYIGDIGEIFLKYFPPLDPEEIEGFNHGYQSGWAGNWDIPGLIKPWKQLASNTKFSRDEFNCCAMFTDYMPLIIAGNATYAAVFRGHARIYGDDKEIFDNRYVGARCKPWVLNERFFAGDGTIMVGASMKMFNPFVQVLNGLSSGGNITETSVLSAFNVPSGNNMWTMSAARAGVRRHRRNAKFDQDRMYQVVYDPTSDPDGLAYNGSTKCIMKKDGTDYSSGDNWQSVDNWTSENNSNGMSRLVDSQAVWNGCTCSGNNVRQFKMMWNLCEPDWDATLLPVRFSMTTALLVRDSNDSEDQAYQKADYDGRRKFLEKVTNDQISDGTHWCWANSSSSDSKVGDIADGAPWAKASDTYFDILSNFTDIKINSIMDGPNLDTKFPLEKGSGSGRKSNFILKNKIL